jgi:hypothetical protein
MRASVGQQKTPPALRARGGIGEHLGGAHRYVSRRLVLVEIDPLDFMMF